MLLLKQSDEEDVFWFGRYLHFTMLLLKRWCICFIPWTEIGFTFHYASIKTLKTKNAYGSQQKFTFHYASIKTSSEDYFEVATRKNLHFTMLLLKLLQFLLLRGWIQKFTFHYASIKTKTLFIQALTLELFTFHYASIKTINNTINMLNEYRIYISLCFY